MTITIQGILSMIVLLIIASLFFSLGNYIQKEGKPVTDFCKEHYNDKTFLETTTYFTQNDPSEPLQCQSKNWRTKTGYCNSTCFERVDECYKENATEEQVMFMNKCQWMGSDYLILVGTVFFKFGFPLMFIVMGIASLFSKEEVVE